MVRFNGGWVGLWMGGSVGDGRIDGGGFCCANIFLRICSCNMFIIYVKRVGYSI